jgi:iron complex outermembrane receptor protein
MKYSYLLFCLLLTNFLLIASEPVGSLTKMSIKGIVINGESHEPIPLAVIRLANSNNYTLSNERGIFEIEIPDDQNSILEVTSLGYKKEIISLNSQQTNSQLIIHLYPLPVQMPTVIVTGTHSNSKFDELHELTNVLKGKDLQRDLGLTLASTLKNETGLAMRSMGPAPARPVIRGLGGDRILISEDGMKTNDLSATSPDHAVSIEPFTIDRIEVIRGPKVLIQNSSTYGGVVNIIREEIPVQSYQNFSGNAGIFGETANNGFLGAFVLRVPLSDFNTRFEMSRRKADDLKTPNKVLKNSDIISTNYSAGLSYVKDWGHIGFALREYELEYGVPGGFVGAHPFGVNISMFKRIINGDFNYKLNLSSITDLSLKLNRTYYRHLEFENDNRIGAEFGIYSYDVQLQFGTNRLLFFNEGSFGLSFENRDFNIGGFVFTPPTKMNNYSAFIYQNYSHNKFSLEVSGRLSYSEFNPRRVTNSAKEEYLAKREFFIYSASISFLYEFGSSSSIGANISKSSRIPTIEELYSEGPHLAAYSYEIGNPSLSSEKGIGTELFYYYKRSNIFFSLNGFYNLIDSYIIPRNNGKINFATLLPIYQTTSVNAVMYGFENQFDFTISNNYSISLGTSYTSGRITESNSPLPSIPPFKTMLTLKYSRGIFNTGIMFEAASAQKKVDYFEIPTDGYLVVNLYTQWTFTTGMFVNSFSLNIDNMLNREYRNHLSRVRMIMPEAKRNIRFTYRVYF